MSDVQLTKTEAKILVAAAENGGALTIPETVTAPSCARMLGRFLRDALITKNGDGSHVLTRAGYRAVGFEPPQAERTGTKRAMVLELLGRREGASLAELVAATGWLPHTTRALLSRLRSGGKPLGKHQRPDGATAYLLQSASA